MIYTHYWVLLDGDDKVTMATTFQDDDAQVKLSATDPRVIAFFQDYNKI